MCDRMLSTMKHGWWIDLVIVVILSNLLLITFLHGVSFGLYGKKIGDDKSINYVY